LSGDETALPEDNETPTSYNAAKNFSADDTDDLSEELGAPYGAVGESGNFDDEDSEDNATPSNEVLNTWTRCGGTLNDFIKDALLDIEQTQGTESLVAAIQYACERKNTVNLALVQGYFEKELGKPRPKKKKKYGSNTGHFGKKRTQFSEPIRETEEWADGQDHGEFDD